MEVLLNRWSFDNLDLVGSLPFSRLRVYEQFQKILQTFICVLPGFVVSLMATKFAIICHLHWEQSTLDKSNFEIYTIGKYTFDK